MKGLTMTDDELTQLEAKARAATPGMRRAGTNERYHVFVVDRESLGGERVLLRMNEHYPYEADAAFIAAASPDVVVRLAAEVKRLRAGIDNIIDAGQLAVDDVKRERDEAQCALDEMRVAITAAIASLRDDASPGNVAGVCEQLEVMTGGDDAT